MLVSSSITCIEDIIEQGKDADKRTFIFIVSRNISRLSPHPRPVKDFVKTRKGGVKGTKNVVLAEMRQKEQV